VKKIPYEIKAVAIVASVIVTAIGLLFGICASIVWLDQKAEESQPKPYQEMYNEGDLKITCNYSASGRLLIKTTYNASTKTTTTYNYMYESNGWGTNLVEVQVITVDENGTIISQSQKE
jgi:hypothetical protein